jgi:hypothetical protein
MMLMKSCVYSIRNIGEVICIYSTTGSQNNIESRWSPCKNCKSLFCSLFSPSLNFLFVFFLPSSSLTYVSLFAHIHFNIFFHPYLRCSRLFFLSFPEWNCVFFSHLSSICSTYLAHFTLLNLNGEGHTLCFPQYYVLKYSKFVFSRQGEINFLLTVSKCQVLLTMRDC